MTSAVTLAQSASAGSTPSFKNRLINGNFEIWQRRPSVESTPVAQSSNYVGADRWCSAGFQEARVQRSAVTAGQGPISQFAMRVGSSTVATNAGGTRMAIRQKIESINCYDLAGQTVTLSFWIRFSSATFSSVANSQSSAFGNFSAYIAFNTTTTNSATSSDVFGDSSSVLSITNGSFPTGWTRYTRTVTVPAGVRNISAGFQVDRLGSTAVADSNWYEVTDVQLEGGSTASPFDERPYTLELLLCQRYYFQSPNYGRNTATLGNPYNIVYAGFLKGAAVWKWCQGTWPVELRTNPSFTNTSDGVGTIGRMTLMTSQGGSQVNNAVPYTIYANKNSYSISEYNTSCYGFWFEIATSAEI